MQGKAGRIIEGVVIEEGHFRQPPVKRRGTEKSAPDIPVSHTVESILVQRAIRVS